MQEKSYKGLVWLVVILIILVVALMGFIVYREFYSDNGTNFVGAEQELREAIREVDSNEFVRNFTTATTKWNFNPPAAPNMGGIWERMVHSIKVFCTR